MESTDVSVFLTTLSLNSDVDSDAKKTDDIRRAQHDRELEGLTIEDKSVVLMEMFPRMKAFDISHLLKKVGNNYSRAVEELLNRAFLEDEETNSGESILKRSIDGFAETDNVPRSKTRNQRRKENRLNRSTPKSLSDGSRSPPISLRNQWARASDDIDFIARRTHLPRQAVSSAYHKSGASLSATIIALGDSPGSKSNSSSTSPTILEENIFELALDFPSLALSQITALIRLTHPSTAYAHELAQALIAPSLSSPISLIPHYRPRSPSPHPRHPPDVSRLLLPSQTTARLNSTRTTAKIQVDGAGGKSKSVSLVVGPAAHYSVLAWEASNSAERREAAVADALVTAQSRAGEVDLHGVTVKDGVRIARECVQRWWGSEHVGEWARAGKVMGPGLRIVTGVGKHSEGGKSRLGPAVGNMLIREGWKLEVGEGVVTVVGRSRG